MKKRRWALQEADGYFADTVGSSKEVHDGTLLFASERDARNFIDTYMFAHKGEKPKPVKLRTIIHRELRGPDE